MPNNTDIIKVDHKTCTICDLYKNIEEFTIERIPSNPHYRRNQCKDCRKKQKIGNNKKTGYWKKRYKAMSEEERAAYIKKKSLQNQYRFKSNPEALIRKKIYDKSDKGIYARYKGDCNRRSRKRRGVKMLLSFDEFSLLINKPCSYCGGLSRGVDRVDSEKSYTIENSTPCCKLCNQMKNDMTKDCFIEHIKKIYGVIC